MTWTDINGCDNDMRGKRTRIKVSLIRKTCTSEWEKSREGVGEYTVVDC